MNRIQRFFRFMAYKVKGVFDWFFKKVWIPYDIFLYNLLLPIREKNQTAADFTRAWILVITMLLLVMTLYGVVYFFLRLIGVPAP